MQEPARGYLTMAVGPEKYLQLAVDMALSLREHTGHPIALAADPELAELAESRYQPVFDAVTHVPRRFRDGRAIKYGAAEASPFAQTMFVDSDCFVLGSLEYLWAGLAEADVAMLGEMLTEQDNENHHGFSTRRLMRRFALERYLKTNSGVFCFRTEPAREIMDTCLDTFLREVRPKLRGGVLRGGWVGDEIGFGVVGGRLGLGTLPFPQPMYWPQEFAEIDLERPAKPLLHFIWPPEPPVLGALLDRAARRRESARVPFVGHDHWLDEVANLRRMARRRRWLERLRIWKTRV
ncbi:MAG: hypothetical protein U5R14_13295 [Gemmatimonadota bacterium]|nr:hypothetical protein [Gemmatimonadota bacterium]